MGTNYYWFREEKKPNQIVDEGLHIGKCSAGWSFHFQAHFDPFQRYDLTSYRNYKEFLKEGYIYTEYDDLVYYDEFIEMVESTRPKKKWTSFPEDREQLHIGDEWEDEGFMFSLVDFC